MLQFRLSLFSVCLVVLFFTQGCSEESYNKWIAKDVGDSVLVGTNDTTPPIASIKFRDPNTGKEVVLKTGDPSQTFAIKTTDVIVVYFFGADPQGVKEVSAYPMQHWDCEGYESGGDFIGCNPSPMMPIWKLTSNAGPGQWGKTVLGFVKFARGDMDACSPNCKLISYKFYFFVKAENFSGMEGWSPTATFIATP